MTEQQKYDVIDHLGAVEVRRYHSCVMADVVVNAPYESAGNIGFGPLVRYISNNNIAMTAPVVQEPAIGGSWTVSFVMPAGMTLETLPRPAGTPVSLREVPAETAAVLKFSGYTSAARVSEKEAQLRSVLAEYGVTATGPVRIARFDPPWKPGFLRRNEVMLPITR
ncbi:MAG: SOUL family heme-binding protein [Microbacteriaceae bacterium]